MSIQREQKKAIRKIGSLLTLLIVLLGAACSSIFPSLPVTGQQPPEEVGQPAATATLEPIPTQENQAEALLLEKSLRGEIYQIARINLKTGKAADNAKPVEIGSEASYAFSPDRSRLAIASKGAGCSGICLRILQLSSLDQVAIMELPLRDLAGDFVPQLVFDAQGKRIAVVMADQSTTHLAILDLSQSSPVLLKAGELAMLTRITAFTPDGKQIMVIGSLSPQNVATPPMNNPRLQAILIDAQTLRVDWRQELPDIKDGYFGAADESHFEDSFYYQAGYAVDSSNRRIYIAHAEDERLTTVDFDQRTTATVAIRPKLSTVERLIEFVLSIGVHSVQAKAGNMYMKSILLSPDGQTLYVVSEHMNMLKDGNEVKMNTAFSGLDTWDVQEGTKLTHVDTQANEVRRGMDGKILLNGYVEIKDTYHPFSEIYDPSLERITVHWNDIYAFVTLSTDGQTALVSNFTDEHGKTILSTLDAQKRDPLLSWTHNVGYPSWLEFR